MSMSPFSRNPLDPWGPWDVRAEFPDLLTQQLLMEGLRTEANFEAS